MASIRSCASIGASFSPASIMELIAAAIAWCFISMKSTNVLSRSNMTPLIILCLWACGTERTSDLIFNILPDDGLDKEVFETDLMKGHGQDRSSASGYQPFVDKQNSRVPQD